jgi:dihydroorotate dehydrogenase
LLFKLGPETAHETTMGLAHTASNQPWACALARRMFPAVRDEALVSEHWGLRFDSPVGLAAGLDKDGVAIDFWAALGFGFVEVGTVTPGSGQPGNEGSRLARFPEQGALLNRMGFNNQGAPALAARLAARRTRIPVGANVGKAKTTPLERAADDYAEATRAVAGGSDFLVVNVSSPNTPGLRSLQAIDQLDPILERVRAEAEGRPVLLKVAPDLADEDLDALAEWAMARSVSGIIATNTTRRLDLLHGPAPFEGGVSGSPLRERAEAVTRRLYRVLQGRVPIIGVGGIDSGEAAYRRIRAGAALVQIYTGFVYGGPSFVNEITKEILMGLERDGFRSLRAAIGADSSKREAEG